MSNSFILLFRGHIQKRNPAELNRLVAQADHDAWQAMSQTLLIKNGFADVQFGYRPGHKPVRGILGACPGEILHPILLGWYK